MKRGPRRKLMSRAVTAAYADRKVMYLKILKAETRSLKGYRRW
jgi:hypothetical protein